MLANSVISVVYYFAVPKQMIFEPARDGSPHAVAGPGERRGRLRLVAIVAVFVFPNPIARAAELSTLIALSLEVPPALRTCCGFGPGEPCPLHIERPVRAWLS